jgi:hypothetical protein
MEYFIKIFPIFLIQIFEKNLKINHYISTLILVWWHFKLIFWNFSYFCAHYSWNRLQSWLFSLPFFNYLFFLKIMLTSREKFLCPWKKSLLSFRIYNKKFKHFVNPLFISKAIKLWHFWDVFSWPNPNQRSCKSICLTSLMAHG